MLKKMEIKEFDQVYTLMEESFPKDEYRDYQKQKELFQNPEYQILIEKKSRVPGNQSIFCKHGSLKLLFTWNISQSIRY